LRVYRGVCSGNLARPMPYSTLLCIIWRRRVPRNVTRAVSFAPNLLITQGTKLVTNAEDVIEKRPAPVRAALTKAEPPESQQRNLLVAASLTGSGQ
jgi:hypothetical protein